MDRVEAFSFLPGHVDQFQSTDFETAVENALNDRASMPRAHCIGFDDSEC
jgi:hypothetical protein